MEFHKKKNGQKRRSSTIHQSIYQLWLIILSIRPAFPLCSFYYHHLLLHHHFFFALCFLLLYIQFFYYWKFILRNDFYLFKDNAFIYFQPTFLQKFFILFIFSLPTQQFQTTMRRYMGRVCVCLTVFTISSRLTART